MKIKYTNLLPIVSCLFISTSSSAITSKEAEEIRTELNRLEQICEIARENKLAPERKKFIAECNNKKRRSEKSCEDFYSTYGDDNTPSLYYDLPECVEAFEYRKNNTPLYSN